MKKFDSGQERAPVRNELNKEDDRKTDLRREEKIDSILEDSFPASDPPSWTLGIEPP
ncbi:MAG TPA: hypothetical protein VJV05_14485 [Pyrinomonadaceae bacterium]|nr:hypothetical protein [Pyrinomonadaceae bacterium]